MTSHNVPSFLVLLIDVTYVAAHITHFSASNLWLRYVRIVVVPTPLSTVPRLPGVHLQLLAHPQDLVHIAVAHIILCIARFHFQVLRALDPLPLVMMFRVLGL